MDSRLTLDRVEYSCKGNNKTMIFIKKDFLHEALQKAKLKYLQSANGRMVSPQYWAGLVIMGDTTSIHLKNKVQWMYYVVIAAFAGILFFYIKSSTSNKKNSKKW